ncbi:hypothetical protein [Actinomadura rubrisoli]|uniref:Tetratricopeptide repeat protein n=1 Tax=Actinomadura rubrisoli TaxID=2530368 RepID=A0A4R5B6D5_9ACTN|nr:hypothetical protein [Actinomadura rubrisoli]TDD79204.1 hypothetical protein E1298_28305 [Actinomadura rubrisoli]
MTEGRTWLRRGLSLITAPSPGRANALRIHGWLVGYQGIHAPALTSAEECCVLSTAADDALEAAMALQVSAEVALHRGDEAVAVPLYKEALTRFRACGDVLGTCACLFQFALCHALRADADPQRLHQAIELCEEGMRISDAFDELWCRSWNQYVYGLGLWRLGQVRSAESAVLHSLGRKRRLRDRMGMGLCLELLAWIAADDGRHEQAVRSFGAARRIWRETEAPLAGFPQLARFQEEATVRILDALGTEPAEHLLRHAEHLPIDQVLDELLGETPPPI